MPDPEPSLRAPPGRPSTRVEPGADPVLRPSDRADFQANGALALAKRLGRTPREVAEAVVAAAALDDLCDAVEVERARLHQPDPLGRVHRPPAGRAVAADPRLGVAQAGEPETGGRRLLGAQRGQGDARRPPPVARSSVTPCAGCSTFVGHSVVRENHIGDWGTPFGMLIEHLVDLGEEEAVHELSVGDLDAFYRQARTSFDADPGFPERSRRRVVLLQSGDPETLRLWRLLVAESVRYFDEVYAKLGVLLTDDDIVGESFYNPMLARVVDDLDALGLLVERRRGPVRLPARVHQPPRRAPAPDRPEVRRRLRLRRHRPGRHPGPGRASRGHPHPLRRRRAPGPAPPDGLRRGRHGRLAARRGRRRARGLRQRPRCRPQDVQDPGRGVGEAGRPARRGGGAGRRGHGRARRPSSSRPSASGVARQLGIGAIKYADLSTDRTRDYVFDWDRMLAFEGNTGPYLQYAHARIRSIFRRARWPPPTPAGPRRSPTPASGPWPWPAGPERGAGRAIET